MSGFVYKWTNLTNNKWYIGSHKGTTDDGYRHSSTVMAFAENKYGLNNFTREILYAGDNFRLIERNLLVEAEAATNSMSYNRSNTVGPNMWSAEVNESRSKALKGRSCPYVSKALKGVPKTKEHIRKISEAKTGVRQSAEHIRNRSAALKGRISPTKGMKLGPQEILICPHCQKEGGISNMKRWHFEKCKYIR